MQQADRKKLTWRYCLWLYKTTKEALDRIERKFTQLEIDRFLLRELQPRSKQKALQGFIRELEAYIAHKANEGVSLQNSPKSKSEYQFLELKLQAIEKAIVKNLGRKALLHIKDLYEQEMAARILKSTEQR
jgi:hypothetical protein